jgi:hypothetical protein
MPTEIFQLFPGGDLGWVLNVILMLFFVVFMFYGQRIQLYVMLREVESSLLRLKYIRDEGKKRAVSIIKKLGKSKEDPNPRIERFLEYVTIQPASMDPAGIVWKLEHILDVREVRFQEEVKLMAPEANSVQVKNLENTLEAALALNIIYKVIRHFYMLGKKTLSLYVIMQLQMILPLIMREAKAFSSALKAFSEGQPIGDGAGPLIAAKLMYGQEKRKIAKDVVAATLSMEGRTVHVLKAEGPGGNVGKPGEGIKRIIEENNGKIASIIVVDAAQKLEGEKTGEVAGGVGVAIGGPGVEQFKVEDTILRYRIPVNAVIVKEDIGDAVSPMRKELFEAADVAIDRIKELIRERTNEGDSVIVAGVGNSIGIGQ